MLQRESSSQQPVQMTAHARCEARQGQAVGKFLPRSQPKLLRYSVHLLPIMLQGWQFPANVHPDRCWPVSRYVYARPAMKRFLSLNLVDGGHQWLEVRADLLRLRAVPGFMNRFWTRRSQGKSPSAFSQAASDFWRGAAIQTLIERYGAGAPAKWPLGHEME